MPQKAFSPRIVLTVKAKGHVPSMKNNKLLTRGRLITKPAYQGWIKRCIHGFECQLRSLFRTTAEGTQTEHSRLYWIPLFARFDDSVEWIEEINVKVIRVPKGGEGAIVIVEQIDGRPQVIK